MINEGKSRQSLCCHLMKLTRSDWPARYISASVLSNLFMSDMSPVWSVWLDRSIILLNLFLKHLKRYNYKTNKSLLKVAIVFTHKRIGPMLRPFSSLNKLIK